MKAIELPLLAGLILVVGIVLAPFFTGKRWWAGVVFGFLYLLVLAGALLYLQPTGSHVSSLRIVDDVLARIVALVAVAVNAFALLLFMDYRRDNPHPAGEAVVLMGGSVLGALVTAMAGDVILLIAGIELTSLPVYVLTGILKYRKRPIEASMKYILLGAFATAVMLYGAGLIFYASGSTSFVAIINTLHRDGAGAVLTTGLAFLLVGIAFKASVAPFHMWTPDVYDGSPTPYTSFMSAVVKFVAFAAFIRLYSVFSFVGALREIVIALAVISMVWGNLAALVQSNIKRMLAYSSVAHAGYILIPLITGTRVGVEAAIFYLIIYAISSAAAFGIIGYREEEEGTYINYEDISGLALKKPLLGLCMVIVFFALAGVPPTGGFMAKFYAFKAAVDYGYWKLALVGIITSMVGAYYYLQVIVYAYMKEKKELKISTRRGFTLAGVLVLSLLILAYGVDPGSLLRDVRVAAETALQLLY